MRVCTAESTQRVKPYTMNGAFSRKVLRGGLADFGDSKQNSRPRRAAGFPNGKRLRAAVSAFEFGGIDK
jgi:hypothetical protein